MSETNTHDVLILGTGLAGLRAAVELFRRMDDRVDIGLVSKVQIMRPHSVCAEGGTAAVLREEEGDNFDLHAWDTVKGSDFLADQDVVDRFVQACPQEIRLLDRWGLPWSRREDGRILQRPFGGHSYPRATMAADKTGFFEVQALYDHMCRYNSYTRYEEYFATSIIVEDGKFCGITAYDLHSGRFVTLKAKALLIASGGLGTLYGFTTYSQTVSGDGQAMAYRAGIALEDPEFLQFHPTGLVPSGILMTEACRGEGGFLRNSGGDRFMEAYAPAKMELAPRDIVSRSAIREVEAGRGFDEPRGLDYVHLDLTHLGADKINTRLPLIREVCMKFLGLDPIHEQIPVRPVAHYSMGGIEADINGATEVGGVWAAGEVACTSLHGGNRLGTNSTAECLVWGGIAGEEIAKYIDSNPAQVEVPAGRADAEEKRVFDGILHSDGDLNPYDLKRELRETMDQTMGVFRTGEEMARGLEKIRDLKKRFADIKMVDRNLVYNTNLVQALEIQNLLDLGEAMALAALERKESRGGHARRDFEERDDVNWLKHSLVKMTDAGPVIDYKPVRIHKWKPVERKY